MKPATYTRHRHAAHYMYNDPRKGHDLEQWTFASDAGGYATAMAAGVPADAEYHSGYVDRDGTQYWMWVRRAPLSGPACPMCTP